MSDNPIFKVLTNKNLFVYIISQRIDIEKSNSWRSKYDHWNKLSDLLKHKHFGLISERIKLKHSLVIDWDSLCLFTRQVNFELFKNFYNEKQYLFQDPDLLYISIENRNSPEIFKLLFKQTQPCPLFQYSVSNIIKLLDHSWNKLNLEVYFLILSHYTGIVDSISYKQKVLDILSVENLKRNPEGLRYIFNNGPSWFLSKLLAEYDSINSNLSTIFLTRDMEIIEKFYQYADKTKIDAYVSIYNLLELDLALLDSRLINTIRFIVYQQFKILLDTEEFVDSSFKSLTSAAKMANLNQYQFSKYQSNLKSMENYFTLVEILIFLQKKLSLLQSIEAPLHRLLAYILNSDPSSPLYVSYLFNSVSQANAMNIVCQHGSLSQLMFAFSMTEFPSISAKETIDHAINNSNSCNLQFLIDIYQFQIPSLIDTSLININSNTIYLLGFLLEINPHLKIQGKSICILEYSLLESLVSISHQYPRILEPLDLKNIVLNSSRNGYLDNIQLLMSELPVFFTSKLLYRMFKEALSGRYIEMARFIINSNLWKMNPELTIPCQIIGKLGYLDQLEIAAPLMSKATLELTMDKAVKYGNIEMIKYLSNIYEISLTEKHRELLIKYGHYDIINNYIAEYQKVNLLKWLTHSIEYDQVEIFQLFFNLLDYNQKSNVLENQFKLVYDRIVSSTNNSSNSKKFIIFNYALNNGAILI